MEELFDLRGLYSPHRCFAVDHAFVHKIHGNLHGGPSAPLPGACLEHVKRAALDRELHVLDVLVVRLQLPRDGLELGVDRRHLRLHLGDWARSAHPGHHVFALGVDQVLAVEGVLAGRGVAAEGDAGGAVVAHVAEDHGLHIHGGAQVIADLIQPPIIDRAPPVPGSEDGGDRVPQLVHRVFREVELHGVGDDRLELPGDLLQLFGREVGVQARLALGRIQDMFERTAFNPEDDLAKQLDEAPVSVRGEPRVAGEVRQASHGLAVQAQVEDGVHHPRHGEFRARAHGDE